MKKDGKVNFKLGEEMRNDVINMSPTCHEHGTKKEHPTGVRKVIGSFVRDSIRFFFVPCSWDVYHIISQLQHLDDEPRFTFKTTYAWLKRAPIGSLHNRPPGNYFYLKGPRTEHRATRALEVSDREIHFIPRVQCYSPIFRPHSLQVSPVVEKTSVVYVL